MPWRHCEKLYIGTLERLAPALRSSGLLAEACQLILPVHAERVAIAPAGEWLTAQQNLLWRVSSDIFDGAVGLPYFAERAPFQIDWDLVGMPSVVAACVPSFTTLSALSRHTHICPCPASASGPG
jgi:hypothetical protein